MGAEAEYAALQAEVVRLRRELERQRVEVRGTARKLLKNPEWDGHFWDAVTLSWHLADKERNMLRAALLGLKLDEALTFEGRLEAHAFFSVDALEAARAAVREVNS